jgi:predicted nucleotidyltransferase
MKENKTLILRCLVGSHAHGLATAESDFDYRGVYVLPASEILSLGYNYKGSHWLEGEKEDQTTWEIAHFLLLATKCNPSILECFVAPIFTGSGGIKSDHIVFQEELRSLFPYLWTPQQAFDAFVGFGLNQRKKMLDNHLHRWQKYSIAYLRALYNLICLLDTGSFNLEVPKDSLLFDQITHIKEGRVRPGWVIDEGNMYTELAKAALGRCYHKSDHNKVNEFLLKIRKEFWN